MQNSTRPRNAPQSPRFRMRLACRSILALKSFSHKAFVVDRADTRDCRGLGSLYDNDWLVVSDLAGAAPKTVSKTSKVWV